MLMQWGGWYEKQTICPNLQLLAKPIIYIGCGEVRLTVDFICVENCVFVRVRAQVFLCMYIIWHL